MTGQRAITIRDFCYESDLAEVLELWTHAGGGVRLGRSDDPAEIRKKLSRDPDLFLVAEAGGELVGAVMGGFDGRRGLVYHLAVRTDYRQQGTGDRLMSELEARMRAKGCLKSYLLVTEENFEAMRFYEKRGWERMPLLIFGKEL